MGGKRPDFSGLWELESQNRKELDDFLVGCGHGLLQRKLIGRSTSRAHFYKHRVDDLQFSCMSGKQVVTAYLKINELTECTMLGAWLRTCKRNGLNDASVISVVSSWDGDVWVTSDEEGRFETRRFIENDRLVIVDTVHHEDEPPVKCKRVFRWVGSDPVWGGYSDEIEAALGNRYGADTGDEDYVLESRNDGDNGDYDFEPPELHKGDNPVKNAMRTSLMAASSVSSAISATVGQSWATLETLFVDKPPPGESSWQHVFGLESSQKLRGAYNCTLSGDITHQGRMYVFDKAVGFYSAIFNKTVTLIHAADIVDVRKLSGLIPPNALAVKTHEGREIVFANFLARERAYELLTRVLWSFSDLPGEKPAPISVGFHGERYIFVLVSSARGPGGGPVGNSASDAFVRLRVRQFEACTPTADNSSAPRFNRVLCFPTTAFDPAVDKLEISLLNEDVNGDEALVGQRVLPLAGAKPAPTLPAVLAAWQPSASWQRLVAAPGQEGAGACEVNVSMWTAHSSHPAFATAIAARRTAYSKKGAEGPSSRVQVFEEPRLAYLFVHVRRAQGLTARQRKVSGMADPLVHVSVGDQHARTRSVQDTLEPAWDDEFTFVVEKPPSAKIVLDLYDGEMADGRFMGQVTIPLQGVPMRRGNSTAKPRPQWFRIGPRRDRFAAAAGRVLVWDAAAAATVLRSESSRREGQLPAGLNDPDDDVDMGEMEVVAYLDSDYVPQENNRSPVGQVAMEVVRARAEERSGDLMAVCRYGRHWVVLPPTSREPAWRQELVFPVRDMGDVMQIAVFRRTETWALSAGSAEPIGRARIRPGSLTPGHLYRQTVPLFLAGKDGALRETGSVDVAVRFARGNAVSTLARYLSLPVPPKCYLDPPAESTAGALARWEQELVEDHLAALDPPLPAEIQRYMRPQADPRLSMRLLRVHLGRLLVRFVHEGSAGPSLLDPEVWWQDPIRMILAHCLFLFLCLFPEFIGPAVALTVAAIGFAGRREVPLFGTDPWLSSGGQYAEAVAAIRGGPAPGEATAVEGEPAPLTLTEGGGAPGGGDALLDGALQRGQEEDMQRRRPGQLAPRGQGGRGRQQSLLSPEEQQLMFRALGGFAKALQDALGRHATRLEQVLGIFAWRDPLVSRSVFTLLTIVGLALFLIPLRSVIIVSGLWFMRHPAFRSSGARMSAFLSRLASDADNIE